MQPYIYLVIIGLVVECQHAYHYRIMTGCNLGSTRVTAEWKKRNRSRRVTKKEKTRKDRGQREGREAVRVFGDKLVKKQGWCILRLSPGPSERAWRDKRGRLYDQRHFNFRDTLQTFLSFNRQSSIYFTYHSLYIPFFSPTHTTYQPTTNKLHVSRCNSQLKNYLSLLLSLLLPMPL